MKGTPERGEGDGSSDSSSPAGEGQVSECSPWHAPCHGFLALLALAQSPQPPCLLSSAERCAACFPWGEEESARARHRDPKGVTPPPCAWLGCPTPTANPRSCCPAALQELSLRLGGGGSLTLPPSFPPLSSLPKGFFSVGSICPGLTALCLAVVFFRLCVGFLRKECLSFPTTLLPAFFFFLIIFFSSFSFRPAHRAALPSPLTPPLPSQESQPSPLALLAATCSRIESPNENSNSSQGQQGGSGELDLTAAAAQIAQSANGWQIISTGSTTPTPSKEQGSNGSNGDPSKSRPVSTGPYVVTAASNLQNQQVLTGLPGVIPNIQYQVIPQFQTIDGQQLQFATTPTQVNVQQDASGQLQIIPGTNQQIITSRAGTGNLIAMPNLLQQAVPIQGVGLANNTLSGQTQYVANVPVALNGNITLLPVNSVAASLAPTSQTVTLSGSGSPDSSSQPTTSGAAISSSNIATSHATSGSFFTNANSYSTTTTTSNMGIMNFSSSSTVGTNVQVQTPQRAPSTDSLQSQVSGVALQPGQQKEGDQSQQSQQQQQQILIQPQLVQGGQTIQALQTAPLSGQTFATQAISQDALQNLQLQAVPNSGPIIIRTPTVGPNGQVSWQTIQLQNLQVQNPQAQTITLAPMQGVSLGQTGSTSTTLTPIASLPSGTVTVNAAQLSSMPGLQTINLSALGASGIQVHQLPGLPLAIANATGKWDGLAPLPEPSGGNRR